MNSSEKTAEVLGWLLDEINEEDAEKRPQSDEVIAWLKSRQRETRTVVSVVKLEGGSLRVTVQWNQWLRDVNITKDANGANQYDTRIVRPILCRFVLRPV